MAKEIRIEDGLHEMVENKENYPVKEKEEAQTVIKRPAKPLHRDDAGCSVRLFNQFDFNMPIYLETEGNNEVKAEVKTEVKDYSNMNTVRDKSKY